MTQATALQFAGKNALITGGGTGIGRAAAIAMAAEGATVTVAGRTQSTLEQTVKLVADAGGTARYVIADVHDEDAVRHAVEVAAGDTATPPGEPLPPSAAVRPRARRSPSPGSGPAAAGS